MANYNAESVVTLEYPEDIQRRIGVYLGGADLMAAFTALREPLDNSVDEALNGHGSKIDLTVDNKTGLVVISDEGRGFPIDFMSDGRSAIEVLCTQKHAGKFIARL